MKCFKVKNFEKFQHYKDRNPPWIKLYFKLLGDRELGYLSDASKFHYVAILLLASQYDNKLPYDIKWLSNRIQSSSKIDLKPLQTFGFIEEIIDSSEVLADCKQVDDGETETYKEETYKEETETEENWLSAQQLKEAYKKIDVNLEYQKMASWCEVNKKLPTRRRFINWLNRIDKPLEIDFKKSNNIDNIVEKIKKEREDETRRNSGFIKIN